MLEFYNPNPLGLRVGDCAVRAISKAMGQTWEESYIDLCLYGLINCDLPSANSVWGKYLREHGFERKIIPDVYPNVYTVDNFCRDHHDGTYVLSTNGHVVTEVDGIIYDTWDSRQNIPCYYYEKE